METYYVAEEWIPPEIAIPKKGFWYEWNERFESLNDAQNFIDSFHSNSKPLDKTRIIKVTREVIE
jgi:hypothetical protein